MHYTIKTSNYHFGGVQIMPNYKCFDVYKSGDGAASFESYRKSYKESYKSIDLFKVNKGA